MLTTFAKQPIRTTKYASATERQGTRPAVQYASTHMSTRTRTLCHVSRDTPRVSPLFPSVAAALKQLQQQKRIEFVFNPPSLDPEEVATLWRLACEAEDKPHSYGLLPERTTSRWELVLRHSFAIQAVYELPQSQYGATLKTPDHLPLKRSKRLIGFARMVSDGVFAALINDVCVHPDYQRQGIGKKLVAQLLRRTRRLGPSSFAVFPRPHERMFWWGNGFRVTSKYRVMRYTGKSMKAAPRKR